MSAERVIELDLGISPDAGDSGAVLLQSEHSAVLLFNALSRSAAGKYAPAGTAVVTFQRLLESRFGGPNDEGRREHHLYDKGMRELGYGVCEVVFSRWAKERAARAEATARRIWGEQFEKTYKERGFASRHFAFLFHDSTFECLANDLQVALSAEPVSSLLVERAKGMASD